MLKRKRISSFLLVLVMLFSVIVALPEQASASSDFNDVGRNHTFYPFVNYVKSEGYVDGYGDGNYGPGDPMTRAQVAKLLVNAKGLTVDEGAKNTGAFKDTNNHDLEPYIAASKGEIFEGYKGNFSPQAKILRGQAAKVVVNALDLKLKAGKALDFKDVPANHEFAEYIAILASQGIVSGYQGKFDPEAELTRGAFAKYVANAATIPAALAAVEKAEETKTQEDFDAAKELVDALPDKTVAADLNYRLDEVKVILLIDSIDDITTHTTQYDTYTLPTTVTALMSNGTTQECTINWLDHNVDTSVLGSQYFKGTVEGYEGSITLTLVVKEYDPQIETNSYSSVTINNVSQSLSLSINNLGTKPVKIEKIEVYEKGKIYTIYTPQDLVDAGIDAVVQSNDDWGISINFRFGMFLDNSYVKYYVSANNTNYEYKDSLDKY